MLARLSPQNAASNFGASIEQALQGVELRVKRLEDQSSHGSLEEALRSAEARIQRLERERDGQAKLYERVESLVTSRTGELRQSMNRSLEVIVDKVRGEVESCRKALSLMDTQLREDLSLELGNLRDLRRHVDSFAAMETHLESEMKATKDVCMAATLQVGKVEESVVRLQNTVSSLPPFLWSLDLGDPPYRPRDPLPVQNRGRWLASGAAPSLSPAPTRRRQSPDSASTEPTSPTQRAGDGDASSGGAGRGLADRASSAERRRRRAERQTARATLSMAALVGDAFMDASSDRKLAPGSSLQREGRDVSRQGGPLSMAKAASEALMDMGREA